MPKEPGEKAIVSMDQLGTEYLRQEIEVSQHLINEAEKKILNLKMRIEE